MAETYEQKKLKRCVICNHDAAERNNNRIFYYDSEFKDYHCDICDGLVKDIACQNQFYNPDQDYFQPRDWLTKTEEFYKTLDFDLSSETIDKIIEEENS